ncbi:MAG: stage III sporulation protein AD [Ruminococcaceae bacterium]|nr:stage III sporulation protein AD [Oscillospiraceae bacterium]
MSVMEMLVAVVGALLCGALLAAVLRTHRPELAMGLSLLAGIVVVLFLLRQILPLAGTVRRMAVLGGLSEGSFAVVFRAAGVCLLTQIVADTCRDAGESALAGKAELAGRVLLLLLTVPLFEQILTLILSVVHQQAVTG